MSDGTNAPGATCDGISFGVKFTGSSPLDGGIAPQKQCCLSDASTD